MSIWKHSTPNLGRNIQRIRELKGIKQKSLATVLGVKQQSISYLEQSETIDHEKLERIAQAMDIKVEDILNFREDAQIVNNAHDQATIFNYVEQYLNPIETIVEMYERLLREKDAMIDLLKNRK